MPSLTVGKSRFGSIFAKVGPANRPSRRFTSSKPSSRLAFSAVGISPFVGESERLEKITFLRAKNLWSGCLGVVDSGFSRRVAETVRQIKGSLKLSLTNAVIVNNLVLECS